MQALHTGNFIMCLFSRKRSHTCISLYELLNPVKIQDGEAILGSLRLASTFCVALFNSGINLWLIYLNIKQPNVILSLSA